MNPSIATQLDNFFKQFKQRRYKKGQIIIHTNEAPGGIFYLKEGFIKQYTISKKGDELIVNVFKPFAFFPMSWAINDSRNNYFFEAITDTTVWIAPKEEVLMFIKNNPEILYDLLSRVYRGVDGILTRMTYLMEGNAYARLLTELIIYAKRFGQGQNRVVITIAEKDLAAQAGMTRETVSREMKRLKEKGLVIVDKTGFILTDVEKLTEELSA